MPGIGVTELLVIVGFLWCSNITLVGIIYNMNVRRIDAVVAELRLLHECMDKRSTKAAEARAQMAADIAALRANWEFVRHHITSGELP